MRKFLLTALSCLAFCFALAQETATIDGIKYSLYSNGEAAISEQYDSLAGDIVIPEKVSYNGTDYTVTSVRNEAFWRAGITSIILPNSITSLGWDSFRSCRSLKSITLPDGITELGDNCFYGCSSLTSITLPEGITSLGESCFAGCSSLASINLPESITSLGSSCFYGCSSLTSITLPEGITSLGERCFENCSSLKTINLPEGITSLGWSCFYGCSSLTSITLPNSIIYLGSFCFRYCENLKSVVCKWENLDNVSVSEVAFHDISSDSRLYIPVGTADMYKATEPWSNFKYIEENSGEDDTPEEPMKCATPAISYADGKLVFTCETDGAEYHYSVTSEDFRTDAHSQDGTVELTAAYNISVYASADGYISSDEAKAVLYFIKAGSGTDVGVSEIFAEERGVVLSTDGQTVTASGLADGEAVSLYTTDGMLLSTAKASADGIATLDTKGERGVLIVKVGNDGLKIAVN